DYLWRVICDCACRIRASFGDSHFGRSGTGSSVENKRSPAFLSCAERLPNRNACRTGTLQGRCASEPDSWAALVLYSHRFHLFLWITGGGVGLGGWRVP